MSFTENSQILAKLYKQLSLPALKTSLSDSQPEKKPIIRKNNSLGTHFQNIENTVYTGLATPLKPQPRNFICPSIV